MTIRAIARRLPRWKTAAALAAATAVASTTAIAGISPAQAAEFTELDAAWVDAPTSVGNNGVIRGISHLNLNDSLGVEGSNDNVVAVFTFDNGLVPSLPEVCKTANVTPASTISADGTVLTCNVGSVQYGTAAVIKFGVQADGGNGDNVTGTVEVNGETATLPEVPITATAGLDLIFDAPFDVQTDGIAQFTTPFAVALPVGSEAITGPITFRLGYDSGTSGIVAADIRIGQTGCGPSNLARDVAEMSTMPFTTAQAPLPTCTVTKVNPSAFDVTLTDYKTLLVDNPTVASDGSNLPTDRVIFATGAVQFTTVSAVTSPSSFSVTASQLAAKTVSGADITETDLSNNRERGAIIPPGLLNTEWSRIYVGPQNPFSALMSPDALPANAIHRVGTGADGSPRAIASDHLLASTESGVWTNIPQGLIPNTARWELCQVLDGPVNFNGLVSTGGINQIPDMRDVLNDSAFKWQVHSAPIANKSAFECNTGFTDVGTTVVGTASRATARRLNVANPAALTAIKLIINPKDIKAGFNRIPTNALLWAGVNIRPNAPAYSNAWVLGSGNGRTGAWFTSSTRPQVAPTPGRGYPFTNSLRDVVEVIPGRPTIDKTVSAPVVNRGDLVTYTLTPAVNVNVGTAAQVDYTVTDTLPPGLVVQPDSINPAPASVDQSSGLTVITWDFVDQPYNTAATITYDAAVQFTSGSRINSASIDTDDITNYTPTTANGGIDTAEVAVTGHGRTILTKETLAPVFALGSTNTWRLSLYNNDEVKQDQTDIIDVLPYNGDERGTAFHGTYVIKDVTANPGETIYYTDIAEGTVDRDPASVNNGGFGTPNPDIWSTTKPEKVTGIRIVGADLLVGETKVNDISWKTKKAKAGDVYNNIAYAKASDTALQMIKAAATTTALDGSVLQVDKELVDSTGYLDGDTYTYDVTVKNPSANIAYEVDVNDFPLDGFDPASAVITDTSVGTVEGAVWHVGDMAAGAVETATVTVTVANPVRGQVFRNKVTVENPSNEQDPQGPCEVNDTVDQDTDQCDLEDSPSPLLKVDKEASKTQADGEVTWTIRVLNDSAADATEVTVTDTYPDGVKGKDVVIVADPSKGTFDALTGVWTVGDLLANETADLKFKAIIPEAKLVEGVVNTVTVDSPEVPNTCDPNADADGDGTPDGCNPDECQVNPDGVKSDTDGCDQTFHGAPSLKVNKETISVDAPAGANYGIVTWKIEGTNVGGVEAPNTVVKDVFPGAVDLSTIKVVKEPTQGVFNAKNGTWNVGTAVPGKVYSITLSAHASLVGLRQGILNKVTITSPDDPYTDGDKPNETLEADNDQYDEVEAILDPNKLGPNTEGPPESPADVLDNVAPNLGGPGMGLLVGGVVLMGMGLVLLRRRSAA